MGSFGWASVLRAAAGLLYNHVLPCFHTSHGVCLHSTDSTCKWRGKTVCEGAVTYEGRTSLQVCEPSGKLKFKKKELVKPGYPLAGREGVWYGEVLCDGDTVIDLHRWWFESRCSNKKMSVRPRSYEDIVRDPRFKQRQ